MIYLLVRDSSGYEDCDRPIFAHHDESVVKTVQSKVIEHHKQMRIIFDLWEKDVELLCEQYPAIQEPDYSKLPAKPLVWRDDRWCNAYFIEWEQNCINNRDDFAKEVDKLMQIYVDRHKISLEQVKAISAHQYQDEPSYSVKEIPDDPQLEYW